MRLLRGILFGLVVSEAWSAVVLRSEKLLGRDGLIMENEFIRVGIIPEIGGRVVEITNKLTSHNLVRVAEWYIPLQPDSPQLPDGEYGGISDVGTDGWPGPFWKCSYTVERRVDEHRATLVLGAESEGVRIERRMTLPASSSKLIFKITETNISPGPKRMCIRLQAEHKVGSEADLNDIIQYIEKGKLTTHRYRLGADEDRFFWLKVGGGWLSATDEVERETLLKRFLSPAGEQRVLYWSGRAEAPPGSKEHPTANRFYALSRVTPWQTVKPGRNIEAEEELWLIRGLKRVDAVVKELTVGVWTDKGSYEAGSIVKLTVGVGSPDRHKPLIAEVQFAGAAQKARIAELSPGEASKAVLSLQTAGLKDGDHPALVRILDEKGKAVVEVKTTVSINSEIFARCRFLLEEATRRLEQFRKALRTKECMPGRVKLRGLEVRLETLRSPAEAGELEELVPKQKDFLAEVDFALQRLASYEPSAGRHRKKLKALLKRYRTQ